MLRFLLTLSMYLFAGTGKQRWKKKIRAKDCKDILRVPWGQGAQSMFPPLGSEFTLENIFKKFFLLSLLQRLFSANLFKVLTTAFI